jgi:hypothetical protein
MKAACRKLRPRRYSGRVGKLHGKQGVGVCARGSVRVRFRSRTGVERRRANSDSYADRMRETKNDLNAKTEGITEAIENMNTYEELQCETRKT